MYWPLPAAGDMVTSFTWVSTGSLKALAGTGRVGAEETSVNDSGRNDEVLQDGDILILYGPLEAVEASEEKLLGG